MTRQPVFAAPWHAQVFAMTVHLNDIGRLAWPDWTERFGETLARHGLSADLDGGDDYFRAWLETLETLMSELGVASERECGDMKTAWAKAYLATPHGQPVRLPPHEDA